MLMSVVVSNDCQVQDPGRTNNYTLVGDTVSSPCPRTKYVGNGSGARFTWFQMGSERGQLEGLTVGKGRR